MKMTAAVLRTQGLPRPYAISQPMTIEQLDLEPPGPGVTVFTPGDRVVSAFVASCGDCRYGNNTGPNPCVSRFSTRAEDTLSSGARRIKLSAYCVTARGGMMVSAGLAAVTAQFTFRHSARVTEEKSIRGSYMGNCVPRRDLPRFIALCRRGKLPVRKPRSGFSGFEPLNKGFDRLAEGAVPRRVLQTHA
jgi:Zn-dependent alcohol dehydrogenase